MRFVSLALTLALLGHGSRALAARTLQVTLTSCPQLSGPEVQRLAEIELATVGGGESNEGNAEATVTCSGDEAAIVAGESGTDRSLSRSLVLASDVQDSDRVVAIAVAQLVRALDWLPGRPVTPVPAAPRQPAPARAERTAPVARSARVELDGSMGLRLRDLEQPLIAPRLAIGSLLKVSRRWAVGAAFSFEEGLAERQPGNVRARLLGGQVRLKLEPWARQTVGLTLRADVGLARLWLWGEETERAVRAAEISGWGLESALAVGPVLRMEPVAVALLGVGGAAYFGGEGLVTGARAVSLDGVWLGTELTLRVEL